VSLYEKFSKFVKKKANVLGIEWNLVPRQKSGIYIEDEKVLRVYVSRKLPVAMLRPKDLIPPEFEGVPVDVVEVGELRAFSQKGKFRPVIAGISGTHYQSTACTVGWFAIDQEDDEVVIICNNHCAARENKARIGDAYLQPSPYDGGDLSDKVGELKRFVPIYFNEYNCSYRQVFTLRKLRNYIFGEPENRVDLAMVRPTEEVSLEILTIGEVMGKRDPDYFEYAQKMGRTTGHTRGGKIIGCSAELDIRYSRGTARFVDVAIIEKEAFSAGGDSSSAILTDTKSPIFLGLLFAGSETCTIFCKTSNIETIGKVSIVTGG